MSDFDDILNQPVEQPEAPSQEKTPRKAEWWQIKADRQRQEAYATLNGIFGRPGRCAGVSRYPRAF